MHPTTRPHSALGAAFLTLSFMLLCLTPLATTSCDNPADDVQKAQTSDPSKTDSAGAGAKASGETVLAIDNSASKFDFIGSKVTASKKGGFKKFSGSFRVSADGKSLVGGDIEIDMDSTYSEAEKLTAHLKNADFFDVPKFPTSKFVVTSVKEGASAAKMPNATHTIAGNLTLHGVTKGIEFAAKLTVSSGSAQLESEFSINRKDFGIMYEGMKDDLIRDDVVLIVDLKSAK